ncbi:MAG TPA: hypothetical protein VIS49_02485 [Cyclobacteriaceae bacterium]
MVNCSLMTHGYSKLRQFIQQNALEIGSSGAGLTGAEVAEL